jgi:hypothetical protein
MMTIERYLKTTFMRAERQVEEKPSDAVGWMLATSEFLRETG